MLEIGTFAEEPLASYQSNIEMSENSGYGNKINKMYLIDIRSDSTDITIFKLKLFLKLSSSNFHFRSD